MKIAEYSNGAWESHANTQETIQGLLCNGGESRTRTGDNARLIKTQTSFKVFW